VLNKTATGQLVFLFAFGLISMGTVGCQPLPTDLLSSKPDPSPTVIPSPALTIAYKQPYMGFSLQLPSSWEGSYKESIPLVDPKTGEFDTVLVDYLPATGEPYMIFGITRVTESEWIKINQDPSFLATELGRRDGQVYYAQTSDTNPYPGADAQQFQQFSLDVPRILDTFVFMPVSLSQPLDD